MYLQQLAIHGIRNIAFAELELSPGINLFFGVNGSGKTSVLEAVHLLSRGRSFRTRQLKNLISHGQTECTCFGLINYQDTTLSDTPIGVQRDTSGNVIFKVAGEQVKSAARLAETLPVQLINAQSFDLLTGSPANRRAFLDWGVFHVEQGFKESWSRFQRCLKQRNSLLRHDKIDRLQLEIWDREFTGLGEQITSARERYLEQLLPVLNDTVGRLGLNGEYRFQFQPGWNRETDLGQLLTESLNRDRRAGFTQSGPHRAEIRILCNNRLAADMLSRGQSKMLVSALKLAQANLYVQVMGCNCLFLLDDLPSELDGEHRLNFGKELQSIGAQALLTAVEKDDLFRLWGSETPAEIKLFHVEHGTVTPEV